MNLQMAVAAYCVLLLSQGCNPARQPDYNQLELVEVTGHVLLDGVPLYDALVTFESPDATASIGRTDELGGYRLMFNSEKSGCTPGLKVVRITSPSAEHADDPDADHSDRPQIPACYNWESQLTANVSPSSRRFDFDLTTNGEAIQTSQADNQ